MSRRTVRRETSSRDASSPPGQSRRACRSESRFSSRLDVVSPSIRPPEGPRNRGQVLTSMLNSVARMNQSQNTNGPAIEVRGLRKSFGDVKALDGVDLVAEQGSVLGV